MDLVGYSRPPMDHAARILLNLQALVAGTDEFRRAKAAGALVSLPTGDGMAMVFFEDPTAPLRCAREVARNLKDYPDTQLRMGIHSGPVYRLPDINANLNVSGGGVNIAQRVMDCGDAGHILLSARAAEIVCQLSGWSESLHDLGTTTVKHGVMIHLYNYFDEAVGNQEVPKKLREQGIAPKPSVSFLEDVVTFLRVTQIPFELLEKGPKHVDLKVMDPSSLFPTALLFCATAQVVDQAKVEETAERARGHGRFSHTFLVTPASLAEDARQYALRRGLSPMDIAEFRRSLSNLSPGEQYVCGEISCRSLLESLGVHEVFVEPLSAPAYPQDEMEYRAQDRPVPAFHLVEDFLEDAAQHMLVILGQYGGGKSALCARLAARYGKPNPKAAAVYVALRHLRSSDDIERIVSKADQLARMEAEPGARILVILDGLDELPDAMDRKERRQNMLRLIGASQRTDKLIVSARTAYFRGLSDFWQFFARAQDEPLWHRLAQSIPGSKRRPRVCAMVIQDFNNDQIDSYVDAIGRAKGHGENFASDFLQRLKENDPNDIYRRLARSPLYLSLLVNSEPWNDASVAGIGDVLRVLAKYWLQRDIEKGPSRWAFTTVDRFEFIYELAWWMFERRKHSISYSDFDGFVSDLYQPNSRDKDVMILDLQTTSFLTCSGNELHFVLPGFFDYLVARRFAEAQFRKDPTRLPTGNQARILLSLLETAQTNASEWASNGERWRNSMCVFGDRYETPLSLSPQGILHNQNAEEGQWWHLANAPEHKNIRAIINRALAQGTSPDERSVKLLIGNKLGLHMRPVANIVKAANAWLSRFAPEERPRVFLKHEGNMADVRSVLQLAFIGAAFGSVVDVVYENCLEAEVEAFLSEFAVRMPSGTRVGCAAEWATPEGWDPEGHVLERR